METFLEPILWKQFQLFRRILNDVRSIIKASSLQGWFHLTEQVKISRSYVRSIGDAPVLSHLSLLRNPWPKSTGVLQHCREGETNCWFFIFRAFPSNRIPKATKDAEVHFFIHCFNFTDELIIDSILAGKNISNISFPLFLSTRNFLRRDDDFQFSRLPFCLWIVQEALSFTPCDYDTRKFGVSISHIYEVARIDHSCFVLHGRQDSRYQMLTEAAHVQHIMKNTLTTPTGISTSARFWSTPFILSPFTISRTRSTFASFVDADGRPLRGSSSKLSRPSWKRLCQSYTWEFFIALSLYAYCNIVDVSACDFCSKI